MVLNPVNNPLRLAFANCHIRDDFNKIGVP
jgi:hypothetical protein